MKTKLLAIFSALLACAASAQFSDGKTYTPTTPTAPVNLITGTNLSATIPAFGAAPSDVSNLQNLYGLDLLTPGANKAAACALSPIPTNAYLKNECNAMNFVRGNKATRMHFFIDPVTDPAIVNGNNATKFPAAHTASTPNVSGSYSACTTTTSTTAAVKIKERCEIGNEVTEGFCEVPLIVKVHWALYAYQYNAVVPLGYCPAGQFRGDQSPYPAQSSYYSTTKTCATFGLGAGSVGLTYKKDCSGADVLVGYVATACELKPTPPIIVAVQTIETCHNAALTMDNCFNSSRQFTTKTTVPLVTEHKDYAACGTFFQYQATIK